MKKIILGLLTIVFFTSCLKNNDNLQELKLLSIDEFSVPSSFTYGTIDSISVKYTLPNSCHYLHSLYYQYQDTTRIVAIRAVKNLDMNCTQVTVQKELKFPIKILQREDYLFKFWKGKDNTGKDLFEEKVVPVK